MLTMISGKRATIPPATTTTQEPVKTFRGLPLPPAAPSAPGIAPPGTQDATVVKLGGEGNFFSRDYDIL